MAPVHVALRNSVRYRDERSGVSFGNLSDDVGDDFFCCLDIEYGRHIDWDWVHTNVDLNKKGEKRNERNDGSDIQQHALYRGRYDRHMCGVIFSIEEKPQ